MNKKKKPVLHIRPIQEGSTIDHIKAGFGLKILKALKIGDFPVTAALHVSSGMMGKKDLVFIEDKFLSGEELDKVALLSSGATVNIIKKGNVVEKKQLSLPTRAVGIIECINPKCITNAEEIETKFSVSKEPISVKCFYCETIMNEKEFRDRIK